MTNEPDGPDSIVAEALTKATKFINDNLSDPLARAVALDELIETTQQQLTSRIDAFRRREIRAARATRSVAEIAEELGMTRSRVYQLLEPGGASGPE